MDSGAAEGVVAAETVLSHSDGERGILWVRGRTLGELVADYGYEGAIALLWEGFAGDGPNRDGIRETLGASREAAFARIGEWLGPASRRPLAEGVRLALAHLPEDSTPSAIQAVLPVGITALLRSQRGEAPVAPDATLGTAADFLRMLHDAPAEETSVEALDTYWTAVYGRLFPRDGRPPDTVQTLPFGLRFFRPLRYS